MTTYLQTLMHLIKGMIGAGIFSMGVAFKNGGMLLALVFTPIMGFVVLHCATLLVRIVTHKKSDVDSAKYLNENSSYADIVERVCIDGPPFAKSIAKPMKILVNVAICTMNLGFCCIYVVFVGTNMQKAFAFFGFDCEIHLVMLMFIIPMWLSSLITNLRWLAPLSMLANTILVVAISITFYFICQDLPRFDRTNYVANFNTVPLFFSVALYTYECIALVVPLRNEMDKPEKLIGTFGVLNVGFFLVIPFVVAMGCISYLKYGEDMLGTVFLNLPENDKLVQALVILVCIQVLFTYPVQMYIPVTIMWPMVSKRFGPMKRPLLGQLCFRSFLVILTLFIGEAIPFVDLVISLVGAICSTCLTLFIPPFLELIVLYPHEESRTKRMFIILKNCVLFALAIAIFITGVLASLRDIIAAF